MTTASTNASFVGSIPEFYDRHLGPVIFEPYAADLAERLELATGATALEVACGTGIVTRHLLGTLEPGTRLVATDLNAPMVDYARVHLPADPRLELRPADAQALPFADGSFARVVCQFGVMFFPDKALALREAKRVLGPGGKLLFNVWDAIERNPFGRIAHETIGSFFESDPPTFYLAPFGWHDPEEIRATVTGAGFRDVHIDVVAKEAVAVSARNFAIGLVRGNPLTLAERGITDLAPVIDAVAAALARGYGEAPFRCPIQALVVSATA